MQFKEHLPTGAIALLGATVLLHLPYSYMAYSLATTGAIFPDIDVNVAPMPHRLTSPLHHFEFATVAMVGSYFYYPFLFPFCLGWFTHLLGDFVQGGVGLFNQRVGFNGSWYHYKLGGRSFLTTQGKLARYLIWASSAYCTYLYIQHLPRATDKVFCGLLIPLAFVFSRSEHFIRAEQWFCIMMGYYAVRYFMPFFG